MKLKPNYLNQYFLFLSSVLIAMFPAMILLFAILDVSLLADLWKELDVIALVFMFLYIAVFLILNLINLLITCFIKKCIVLDYKDFTYMNNLYKYEKVTELYYDVGSISKTGGHPAQLIIQGAEFGQITFNHPSIRLLYQLKKRCSKAKFKTNILKMILMQLAIYSAVSIVIPLLYKFGFFNE